MLKDYEEKYNSIMESNLIAQKNRQLARLMTKMENEFQIPLFNDEKWNAKNKEVIELYRKISYSRNF